MLTLTISPLDHYRRFESYLRTLMPSAPSGYARKLIKSGATKRNGAPAHPDSLLVSGDTVTLKESSTTAKHISTVRPALDILYEDSQIAVVNKPSGLPMHRTAECEDNLVEFGQAYMVQRNTACKLYPVNRLDRGTSGAVILAKSSSAAGAYGRLIKETGLDKLYLALVSGVPDDNSRVITMTLDGKDCETHYQKILSGRDCSMLAVTPFSGRMHQIRRHLAGDGFPIIGDKRYGGGEIDELPGFALHSFRTIVNPYEAPEIAVCAPITDGMLNLCEHRGMDKSRLLETLCRLV